MRGPEAWGEHAHGRGWNLTPNPVGVSHYAPYSKDNRPNRLKGLPASQGYVSLKECTQKVTPTGKPSKDCKHGKPRKPSKQAL